MMIINIILLLFLLSKFIGKYNTLILSSILIVSQRCIEHGNDINKSSCKCMKGISQKANYKSSKKVYRGTMNVPLYL